MNILVTGGAGYIGSHAVKALVQAGHNVVVIDNLFRGHRAAVTQGVPLIVKDLEDWQHTARVLRTNKIDCVIHFAALAYVGESVDDPLWYYQNNTASAIATLQAMHEEGVQKIVFSSTCATYGEPDENQIPINESCTQSPINPYGRSKLMVEEILTDYAAANPEFAYAALRYFNVAGCAVDGQIGEDHRPETHLIPIILQAALGQRDKVTIFGTDYDTPDGTCVRDYVHVEDLVSAHILAMDRLKPGSPLKYNIGIGRGYSVREIIDAVERVTGTKLNIVEGERRPGDPPKLFADSSRIQSDLGWSPKHTEIDDIIASAWQWFQNNPDGYQSMTSSVQVNKSA